MSEIYEETLKEVAEYFDTDVEALRVLCYEYLQLPYDEAKSMDDYQRAVCYAVYRIVKLKTALMLVSKSRQGWKERAESLGSPPHLRMAD